MVTNFRVKAILTALLMIGAVVIIFVKPITLGLDLAGGTYLRYSVHDQIASVDASKRKDEIDSMIDILRARIDSIGIKETPIRSQGEDEIIVELPGSSETEAVGVQNVIESQGRLEFRLKAWDEPGVDVEAAHTELEQYFKDHPDERTNRHADLRKLTEKLRSKGATYSWVPLSDRYLRGRYGPKYDPKAVDMWVLVKIDPAYPLTGGDLEQVYPGEDNGKPAVAFKVKSDKAPLMGQFTENNVHKSIVVVLDGDVESVAEIQSKISDQGQINGGSQGFTQDEVKHLMTVLKSGALPLKPVLQSRNQIGPSLGEDSIKMGKISSIASMLIVALFMVVYYRMSGVVACVALIVNIALMFAVLVLLQATLTLPGIAGIALTMGMAVDANILIHERMREEREKGKSVLQATKLGFERAFATIVDSNLTTFFAGFILYYCGTGPVRGFAVTLMLGILTTLFTALTISKLLFHWLIERGSLTEIKMLKWVPDTNIQFTRYIKASVIGTGILMAIGLAIFFWMGNDKWGLDFTGGYKATVQLIDNKDQGEVRRLVNEVYPGAEVVSVGGEHGQARIFQVKIKRFTEGEEAKTASTPPASSPAAAVADQTPKLSPPPASEPSKGTASAEHIKEGLRAKLGSLLMPDGISGMKAEPDPVKAQTGVAFTVTYTGDVPKATVEKNAKGFLFDAAVDGPETGKTFAVHGVYNVVSTAELIRARATTEMKNNLPPLASVSGGARAVELSEPFMESDLIGPRVGGELRDKAIIALFLSFLVTVIYVRVRFHGYSWGIGATIALIHDVCTTVGALSIVRFLGIVNVEFDLTTVAVLLTIVGYSINDTIVIFDRIRENLPRMSRPFKEVVDLSVNQTLSRTLLTSLTVFLTSLVIFVLNYGKGNVLEEFSFGMLFGVLTGTFSSVYIASPIVIWIVKRSKRAAAGIMAGTGASAGASVTA